MAAALKGSTRRPWIVVVTSDHGEGFASERSERHHGTALVEQQLRIPWIAWSNDPELVWPEPAPMASLIDVAPSLLRRAGLALPASFRGDPDRLTGEAPGKPAAATVESAFFPYDEGDRVEAELVLIQAERALVWLVPPREPARGSCLGGTLSGPGLRSWTEAPAESCRDLDDEARRRLRRLTTPVSATPSRAIAGGADTALAEELRSLGYL